MMIQQVLSNAWKKIEPIKEDILTKKTVAPATLADYLNYTGTVTIFLIVIQLFTGLLLLVHYSPNPLKAFESVITIKNEIPDGFLFLTLHTINAKLIVLMLFIHMFRIMWVTAFRGPRQIQWYTGAALLTLMLLTGFSGYLLPWSQQSYWACVIGTEALRSLPVIGLPILYLLRGGTDVTGTTLLIFYVGHIIVLPILIAVFLWYHIKKVWQVGVAGPADMSATIDRDTCVGCGRCETACDFTAIRMAPDLLKKKTPLVDMYRCNGCRACLDQCPTASISLQDGTGSMKMEKIFPHNTLHRLMAILVSTLILFVAVFCYHHLLMEARTPANPLVTPDQIKPDWYFMGAYQVLKLMPSEFTGLMALLGTYLVMILLPFIDRSGPRSPEKRPIYMFLVKASIFSFIFLTIWGFVS